MFSNKKFKKKQILFYTDKCWLYCTVGEKTRKTTSGNLNEIIPLLQSDCKCFLVLFNKGYLIQTNKKLLFPKIYLTEETEKIINQLIKTKFSQNPQLMKIIAPEFILNNLKNNYATQKEYSRLVSSIPFWFVQSSTVLYAKPPGVEKNLIQLEEKELINKIIDTLNKKSLFKLFKLSLYFNKLNEINKNLWFATIFSMILLMVSFLFDSPFSSPKTETNQHRYHNQFQSQNKYWSLEFYLSVFEGIKKGFSLIHPAYIKTISLKKNLSQVDGIWLSKDPLNVQNELWKKLLIELKNQPFVDRVVVKINPLKGVISKEKGFAINLYMKKT